MEKSESNVSHIVNKLTKSQAKNEKAKREIEISVANGEPEKGWETLGEYMARNGIRIELMSLSYSTKPGSCLEIRGGAYTRRFGSGLWRIKK